MRANNVSRDTSDSVAVVVVGRRLTEVRNNFTCRVQIWLDRHQAGVGGSCGVVRGWRGKGRIRRGNGDWRGEARLRYLREGGWGD